MAKIINNKKGFLIIEMSLTEVVDTFQSVGICDSCNKSDFTGYYISVLNSWYCSKCYEEWNETSIRYPEDIIFEKEHFKKTCNELGLIIPNG